MAEPPDEDAELCTLPDGYYQRATSFSKPVMIAHAVTLEVELRKGGQAVRMAIVEQAAAAATRPATDRGRPRASPHPHEHAATLGMLGRAYDTSARFSLRCQWPSHL